MVLLGHDDKRSVGHHNDQGGDSHHLLELFGEESAPGAMEEVVAADAVLAVEHDDEGLDEDGVSADDDGCSGSLHRGPWRLVPEECLGPHEVEKSRMAGVPGPVVGFFEVSAVHWSRGRKSRLEGQEVEEDRCS